LISQSRGLGDVYKRQALTGRRAVPQKLLDNGFKFEFTKLEESISGS
jgi:NAD dependent epimerase/dehydratase family enzyme